MIACLADLYVLNQLVWGLRAAGGGRKEPGGRKEMEEHGTPWFRTKYELKLLNPPEMSIMVCGHLHTEEG